MVPLLFLTWMSLLIKIVDLQSLQDPLALSGSASGKSVMKSCIHTGQTQLVPVPTLTTIKKFLCGTLQMRATSGWTAPLSLDFPVSSSVLRCRQNDTKLAQS